MGRHGGVHRYRPYRRSLSVHWTSVDIFPDYGQLEDSVQVVFDSNADTRGKATSTGGSVCADVTVLAAWPTPAAASSAAGCRPVASTPSTGRRRRHSSDVLELSPPAPVVTLEDGELESTPEVTEVRRVCTVGTPLARGRAAGFFEDLTPAVTKVAPVTAGDLSADYLPLARSSWRVRRRRSSGEHRPNKARKRDAREEDGGRHRRDRDERAARKAERRARRSGRPLHRTSSTQRRLQSVVRIARRTLAPPLSVEAKRRRRQSRQRLEGGASPYLSRRPVRSARAPHLSQWTAADRQRSSTQMGAPAQMQFNADFRQSFASMLTQRAKRPVVIDGPNVAYAHGRDQVCSCRGIAIALDYFQSRGHRCVVFVPSSFMNPSYTAVDKHLLSKMYSKGDLSFTPSRLIEGRRVTCYDDRYVVMYAASVGGVILSRDQYRDVAQERDDWRRTIEQRLLIPVFVLDQLMLPPDPMGRNGPGLDEFLTFPPGEEAALLSTAGPPPTLPREPPPSRDVPLHKGPPRPPNKEPPRPEGPPRPQNKEPPLPKGMPPPLMDGARPPPLPNGPPPPLMSGPPPPPLLNGPPPPLPVRSSVSRVKGGASTH